MLVDIDKKKMYELFMDPDDFETEEEAKAAYFFPSTKLGKKMLADGEKSGNMSYLEFKISMKKFVDKLKANAKHHN